MNLNKNLLCVKWDEFDHFVVNGLSNLYQRDEMADATLFCDGRSFKAHRVILSVWSSYFKEVFAATSHPHPVIILRETTSSDLELLLRFIYQGQLFIPFEDADRFLKTAEYFQIAGLREMRIHSSSTGGDTATLFQSSLNLANNNISKSKSATGLAEQSMPGTSFVPVAEVNNSNNVSPGIPIQITSDSNSPSSTASSSQLHYQHSNISPISINTDHTSQGQFSTNVIKPNNNTRQQRTQQTHSRPISPVQLTQSYQSARTNNIKPIQQEGGPLYQTQPQVLIVHNQQRHNEYHSGSKNFLETTRGTEQVVVLERVGSGNQMIQSINQANVNINENSLNSGNTFAVYSQNSVVTTEDHSGHGHQEEVLGLAYLHDNNTRNPSQSQIIQEAAVAAGVVTDEAEIMEITRDSSISTNTTTATTTAETQGSSRTFKPNSVVLTSTTTPVYAVKRVPQHSYTSSTTNEPNQTSTASSSSSKTFANNISRKSRTKKKTTIQEAGTQKTGDKKIELVTCPKCKKRVKQTSLKVHMKRTHLEEGTVLVCPLCDKQISSKGVYYKHMYVHRQKSDNQNVNIRKSDKNQQSSNLKSESLT